VFKNKTIGIIGYSSKRYNTFYRNILNKLECNCLLWNRTNIDYNPFSNEKIVKDITDLENSKNLDLILCFIKDTSNFNFLSNFKFKSLVLIETPVTDTRWIDFDKFKVGVLEQWINYPLELFKEKIYNSKILNKPYQLFNDGRTFDYHAISQLRKFANYECKAI
jgi:hypothetical protein